jgi:chromosome segregation ATPase
MSDRNLEEAIFQLQKLNTENGVKQLVEEAAQLFSKGRNIEAGALVEKAEAIVAKSGTPPAANRHCSAPAGHSDQIKAEERLKVDERTRVDEQAIVNMAGKLADGLSKILTGAFQELERHIIGESHKISTSLEQQLHRLQATIDSLVQLRVKFEQLTEAVSEQKEANAAIAQKRDQASGQVTALEENVSRHETELGALRGETTTLRAEAAALRTDTGLLRSEAREFSTVTAQQIEGVAARLGLHQEELTGLKSTVSEISRKVTGILERLDRQAEVIRSLNETQTRRTAALDELLGVLTRLKAPVETMMAAAAGQL